MRRWFIAIFALHFLVSVGFFAIGQVDVHGLDQANFAAAAEHAQHKVPASHEGDLLGHAPDHGLTDSQPELPDQMQLVLALAPAAQSLPPPATLSLPIMTTPNLDGLRRPPRG